MAGASSWARSLRGLVAALLLAVLTLGPTVDSLVCGGDVSFAAAASEAQIVNVQASQLPDDHGSGMADVCMHGHCHHYAPFFPAQGVGEHSVNESPAAHDSLRATIRTSDPHFGLKRPPRA